MTFKEFFVKQNYSLTPDVNRGHKEFTKLFKKPQASTLGTSNVLPSVKPPSILNTLAKKPLLQQQAPSKPSEFLKRGSGFSPTTQKGFRI